MEDNLKKEDRPKKEKDMKNEDDLKYEKKKKEDDGRLVLLLVRLVSTRKQVGPTPESYSILKCILGPKRF